MKKVKKGIMNNGIFKDQIPCLYCQCPVEVNKSIITVPICGVCRAAIKDKQKK